MFGRHKEVRRRKNPILIFFRLILSLVVFGFLLSGLYFAYIQFSGVDPLKVNPKNLVSSVISKNKNIQDVFDKAASLINIKDASKIFGVKDNIIASSTSASISSKTSKDIDFTFLIVSDSHNDNVNLSKALAQSKQYNPSFIVGLGDYTQVGTIEELKNAKKEFDLSGVRYFLVPGDHDLWDSRDKGRDPGTNFKQVFGLTYQSFVYNGYDFILINNADNYIGISDEQNAWILATLQKSKEQKNKGIFVMMQEPLYHPSSDHVMGKTNPKIQSQAKALIYLFKENAVKTIFAGDVHFFAKYKDPGTDLDMVASGAVTSSPNVQAPRYTIVNIYSNGEVDISDVEIK